MELQERDGMVYLQNAYCLETDNEEIVGNCNYIYEHGPFIFGIDSRIYPSVFRIFFDREQYQNDTGNSVEGEFVGLIVNIGLKVNQTYIPPYLFSKSALEYMVEYESDSEYTAYMIGNGVIQSIGDYATHLPLFPFNAVKSLDSIPDFFSKGAQNGCFLSIENDMEEGYSCFASAFFPIFLDYPAPIHKELIDYVTKNGLTCLKSYSISYEALENPLKFLLCKLQTEYHSISQEDFTWIQSGEDAILFCWEDQEMYPYYLFVIKKYHENGMVDFNLYSIEREVVEKLLDIKKIQFIKRIFHLFPNFFTDDIQPGDIEPDDIDQYDSLFLRVFEKIEKISMDVQVIVVSVSDEEMEPLAECRCKFLKTLENGQPIGKTNCVDITSGPYDISQESLPVSTYRYANTICNSERTEQWFDTHVEIS